MVNIRYIALMVSLMGYGVVWSQPSSQRVPEGMHTITYTKYEMMPLAVREHTIPFNGEDVRTTVSLFDKNNTKKFLKGDLIPFAGQEYKITHYSDTDPNNMKIIAFQVKPRKMIFNGQELPIDKCTITINGPVHKLGLCRDIFLTTAKGYLYDSELWRTEKVLSDGASAGTDGIKDSGKPSFAINHAELPRLTKLGACTFLGLVGIVIDRYGFDSKGIGALIALGETCREKYQKYKADRVAREA